MFPGGTASKQSKEDALIAQMKTSAGGNATAATATAAPGAATARNSLDALFGTDSPYNPNSNGCSNRIGSGPPGGIDSNSTGGAYHSPAAQEASDNLRRALRTSEATNTTGYATMQSLGKQRETIQHSLHTVDGTHQHLQDSRQVIRDIRMQVYKEWLIKGSVVAVLVMLIIFIFWVKFLRKRS